MFKINFNDKVVERGEALNLYGKVVISGVDKDVVCIITHEFLQDINKGSTKYLDTFNQNKFTIETMAEDNLNLLSKESLASDLIKVYVTSSNITRYEL